MIGRLLGIGQKTVRRPEPTRGAPRRMRLGIELLDARIVPSTLGDRVWSDTNSNGIQDSGEPGISGVTVRLINNGTQVATTTTNASGNYSFDTTSLTGGSLYWVQLGSIPSGYTLSPLDQGSNDAVDNDFYGPGWTDYITITPGVTSTTVDCGLIPSSPPPPASVLGDRVFRDANANGIQDSGETGVSGVAVRLYKGYPSQVLIASTTTNASGNYSFATGSLTAGSDYWLQITIPSGYTLSPSNAGSNDAVDNDFYDNTNSWTDYVTITPGVSNTTVDAGLVPSSPPPPPAVIGDRVWRDNDGDGIQDAGEPGLAGVFVQLVRYDAPSSETVVATTTTNASGLYSFSGIPTGTYKVRFTLLSGYYWSPVNAGSDDTLDSDVLSADNGATFYFGYTAGTSYTVWDAGMVPL